MSTKVVGLLLWEKSSNVKKTIGKKHSRALGVYNGDVLIGHVPIEISARIDYFLKESEENYVDATVTGKRKRGVGLVVPTRFTAVTADERTATHCLNSFRKNLKSTLILR